MKSYIILFILTVLQFVDIPLYGQWSRNSETVRLTNGADKIWINDVAPIGGGANRFYLNGDPDNYGNLLVNINGEGLSATQSLMKLAANAGSNAASTLLYGSLSGSTVFKFEASGKLSLLDVNGSYYTAMEVRDDQAIWYDGDQFSWGFGGTWNRFARPITIGGNSPTPVGTALLITGGNDIRMEGGGARRIRFHQGLIEEGYVGYADNILTIQNNTGEYIMLRSNGHDQLFIGEDASLFGDLNMTGGINGISDRRTKQDIKPISNALETILALNGKTYQFKREEFPALDLPTGNQYGLIAQEVEEILPDLVSTHTPVEIDGEAVNLKGIEYQALIPVLIEAIKEQNKIIEAMKGQIKQLEQSMVSQN